VTQSLDTQASRLKAITVVLKGRLIDHYRVQVQDKVCMGSARWTYDVYNVATDVVQGVDMAGKLEVGRVQCAGGW
jgi:hypothetical protein